MKDKIAELLPNHILKSFSSNKLYLVDYKDINGGDVEILEVKPQERSVILENPSSIQVLFDGFGENALPLDEPGSHCRQCECVIFPERVDVNDWVLFIETKYANNIEAAFNNERDYPRNMVDQVIETVKYFRKREIIPQNKRVNAILSFPKLISSFNANFFPRGNAQVTEILINHGIKMRATNSATIISEKRIKLGAN